MPEKKTIKKKMWVERDLGTDLSDSKKSPGKKSPLLRDAKGDLAGHAVLSDIDDDDDDDYLATFSPESPSQDGPSELAETITELLTLLTEIAMSEAAPHVMRWWNEQAAPAIKARAKSARSKIANVLRPGQKGRKSELAIPDNAAIPLPPVPVEATPVEEGELLTSEEAQQLLVSALVARAFSDEQLQVLRNARIQDADQILDIKRSLAQYTPSQIEAQVRSLLEANPNVLDEFAKVLAERPATAPALLPRRSISEADPQTLSPPEDPAT